MTYTSTLPPFLRDKALKFMRHKDAIPALGIVSGNEDEQPGVDLAINEKVPLLTQSDLEHDINEILDQDLNVEDRTFSLRNLYIYTLNDARVALMMDQAMKRAFESKATNKPAEGEAS
jgi:hypothetical protein